MCGLEWNTSLLTGHRSPCLHSKQNMTFRIVIVTQISQNVINCNKLSYKFIVNTFVLDFRQFSDIYVSQGSVATRLRCGRLCNDLFVTGFIGQSDGKRILKIGQHLTKLWTRAGCPLFDTRGSYFVHIIFNSVQSLNMCFCCSCFAFVSMCICHMDSDYLLTSESLKQMYSIIHGVSYKTTPYLIAHNFGKC